MKLYFRTFINIFRNPYVLLVTLLTGILLGYLETRFSMKDLIVGFFAGENLQSYDIINSIVYFISIFLKALESITAIKYIGAGIVAFTFVFTLISCLVFTHYNAKLYRKKIGLWATLRTHFIKIFFKTLIISSITVIFFLLIIVALVPAIVMAIAYLENAPTDPIFWGQFAFIYILTAFVLFFATYFVKGYLSFWYAATMSNEKRAFRTGKKIADIYFWKMSFNMFFLDIVNILVLTLIFSLQGSDMIPSNAIYLIRGVVISFCFYYFVSYVLVVYNDYIRKIMTAANK